MVSQPNLEWNHQAPTREIIKTMIILCLRFKPPAKYLPVPREVIISSAKPIIPAPTKVKRGNHVSARERKSNSIKKPPNNFSKIAITKAKTKIVTQINKPPPRGVFILWSFSIF